MKSDNELKVGDIVYIGEYKGVVIDRNTDEQRYALMLKCGIYFCGQFNTLKELTNKIKSLDKEIFIYHDLTTDILEEKLINLIAKEQKIDSNYIECNSSDNCFAISVFDKNKYNQEYQVRDEYNEPILEQYVLVPISKIQNNLNIIL